MPDKFVSEPVFRFAPSPNGLLHLGHAYSALVNFRMSQELKGRFLLRLEDIDIARCSPAYEEQIFEDLDWLGLSWEMPVRRQSECFEIYEEALLTLREAGMIYPATLSRSALQRTVETSQANGETWPHDPDGAPLYPTDERNRTEQEQNAIISAQTPFAWRLNIDAARQHVGGDISWTEWIYDETQQIAETTIKANPTQWGDVILARKDTPTSYHLSVVIDDALQGVTHIVRGADLKPATHIHRLLQSVLGLRPPIYYHHDLIMGEDGRKLSKSNNDTSLKSLRDAGLQPEDIVHLVGL